MATVDLGSPTSGVNQGKGFTWQHFQKGVIYSSAATGAHAIMGNPSDSTTFWGCFVANDFERGVGLPTSEVTKVSGLLRQYFQQGIIADAPRRGAIFLHPIQRAADWKPDGMAFGKKIGAADYAAAAVATGVSIYTMNPGPLLLFLKHWAKEQAVALGKNLGISLSLAFVEKLIINKGQIFDFDGIEFRFGIATVKKDLWVSLKDGMIDLAKSAASNYVTNYIGGYARENVPGYAQAEDFVSGLFGLALTDTNEHQPYIEWRWK